MSIKEQKIKLILQYLRSSNYNQTFQKLQQQSQIQLDPEHLLKVTQSIKSYNYTELESILQLYVDDKTKNQCMLLLLQQYFIQLILSQNYQEAVQLLRNQISKFCLDEQQKYLYGSMIFNQDLKLKAEQQLIDEILSLCFQQLGLFESNRLKTLIQQTKSIEILECKWHQQLEQNYQIQQRHSCKQELKFIIKQKNVNICAFSDNGEYQALASEKSIMIYQINQIEKIKRIDKIQDAHSKQITNILFSPCNKYIGSSSEDCTVLIYNIINKKKYRLQGHNSTVQSFNFVLCDPSRKKQKNEYDIYSISVDGWLYEWNENERRGGLKIEEKLIDIHSNQEKEQLLIISQNKMTLYQLYSKTQIIQTSKSNQTNINSQVNKQFEQLIVFVNDYLPQLNLYNIQTLQIIKILKTHAIKSIKSLTYHIGWFNDNLVAAGTDSGQLIVWHVQKSEQPIQMHQISEQKNKISCLRFHPTCHELLIYTCQNSNNQSTLLQRQQQQENLLQLFSLSQDRSFQRQQSGVTQILNFLQRIARSDTMNNRESLQDEDQQSSDEDL